MEKVSLLKVRSYEEDLTAKITILLNPLGGLASFCHAGDRVLIKPNFIMARPAEQAATTHPAVILALVTLLKEHGCTVGIGDSPGIGSTESVLRKLGIYETLQKYQVEIVEFGTSHPAGEFVRTQRFERRFKNLELAKEITNYDRIINLAKLKSHGQMGITLATKNLFGCVVGHNKGRWHFAAGRDLNAFARLLVEIAFTVNADLHIIDGIIGMDGNGPSNGRPRELGLLIAGTNPIATDRVVVELVQKKPEQFPIFGAAKLLAIPETDMNEITVTGESIANCLISEFKIPALVKTDIFVNRTVSRLLERLLKQKLILNKQLCIDCRKCEAHCPAEAIKYETGIRINDQECIRCCCCQEMCPVGALSVSDPLMVKVLRKLKLM